MHAVYPGGRIYRRRQNFTHFASRSWEKLLMGESTQKKCEGQGQGEWGSHLTDHTYKCKISAGQANTVIKHKLSKPLNCLCHSEQPCISFGQHLIFFFQGYHDAQWDKVFFLATVTFFPIISPFLSLFFSAFLSTPFEDWVSVSCALALAAGRL